MLLHFPETIECWWRPNRANRGHGVLSFCGFMRITSWKLPFNYHDSEPLGRDLGIRLRESESELISSVRSEGLGGNLQVAEC